MSPKRRRHRIRESENVARNEEEVGLGVGSAAQRYAAYKAEAQAAASLRARWVSTLSFLLIHSRSRRSTRSRL